MVHAAYTYSSGSAVILTCSESPDAGSTLYPLVAGTTSAGVQTLTAASKTYVGTASVKIPMRFDIRGFDFISCVWSVTGGGAGDLVTLKYNLVGP